MPGPATPRTRELARRMLMREAGTLAHSSDVAGAMQSVCRGLRENLGTVVGYYGIEALFGRALRIASIEFPWLGEVTIGATDDPCIGSVEEAVRDVDPEAARDGCAEVVAGMLGLLGAFIGEDVAIGMVHEAWPDLAREAA